MNDFFNFIIVLLAYIFFIGVFSWLYTKLFIACIINFNYFGYIMGSNQSIKNKMNSLKPSEVKNLINELSIFKFSTFITYVGFIIVLLSFIIGQLSNAPLRSYPLRLYPLRSYIVMTILISVIIIIGSFFTWLRYNESVLYVKEYFYENFDENTYKLKNNIKKP